MVSPQDKMMYVAQKLGLSTLKDMQGSTRAIYDADPFATGTIFKDAPQHLNPGQTNLTSNRFEVNEALLIEQIQFYFTDVISPGGGSTYSGITLANSLGNNVVVVFDLIIGNKKVIKSQPVFANGSPWAFSNQAIQRQSPGFNDSIYYNAHATYYLEGAGILIPPQVEFQIDYKAYFVNNGTELNFSLFGTGLGASIFGTAALLNFNTTI